jgi:23S rRNA pseudouridine1911/1915/1917 synthase
LIENKAESSISLLEQLKKIYPKSSNSTLRNILKNKRVFVDNKVVIKANFLISAGQTIKVTDKNKFLIKPLPNNLKILYEDNYLIIINKPEVLLSVPSDNENVPNILAILRKYYNNNEIFAVHRIDKETSGVMIYAKGIESREKIDEMFKNHFFKRVYLAIVQGNVKDDFGTWKSRLIELDNFQVVPTEDESKGKIAITHYKVLKRLKKYNYLELTLETGRKHQIRVQAKEFGHPIVGDKRYGLKSIDPISRICLHAYLLEFDHPFFNKKMSFNAPIPYRFSQVLNEDL